MTTHKCKDSRCLFHGKDKSIDSKFETVTTQTREGEGLWEKCSHCGLVINRLGVAPDEADDFYNKDYVEKNSFSKGELQSAKQRFEDRLSNIKVISDFLIPYLKKDMRVFELGAATGELLYHIKQHVDYCHGNEINQLYASFISSELGIESSHIDYFKLNFEKKLDFIIAVNTIDHIYETGKVVEKVYNDLNKGGYFYVEVPNDGQALKEYFPEPSKTGFKNFMYQKAHYFSFTFETLGNLLKQTGFEIVKEVSRHDYTLNNYLNWYYTGSPQKRFKAALEETDIHNGDSGFEREMNTLFADANIVFKTIMSKYKVGETICILAKKS